MSQQMSNETNALNWFEIPAGDIDRATTFYENIFGIKMSRMDMMGNKMSMFPTDMMTGRIGGALVQSAMHFPSKEGAVIYLNGNPDVQQVLDRIPGAGGHIVMPKTKIGDDIGYMAFFHDSEGNHVGLHSNN